MRKQSEQITCLFTRPQNSCDSKENILQSQTAKKEIYDFAAFICSPANFENNRKSNENCSYKSS